MKDLRELYLEQLQDIYSAETQLVEALPKMAWKARSTELKEAFGSHLDETKGQVARLEEIFKGHPSVKPGAHKCKAMKGLIAEGEEALETSGDSELIDAHLIAAAFRVEHYEIAAYKTAISMAKALKLESDAKLLKHNLGEEGAASDELEKMANGSVFTLGVHEKAVS